MRSALVLLGLAACSAPPSPTPSGSAPPPPTVAAPKPCVVADPAEHDLAPDSVAIDGDRVEMCITSGARTCWRASISARTIAAVPVRPEPASGYADFPMTRAATATAEGKQLRLCTTAGRCRLFPHPGPGTDPNLRIAVSEDLATVAIADERVVRIYDTAAGRVRATIPGWKTEMSDGIVDQPTFAGDRVIVWVANSPISSEGRIYDLDGRKVAAVGPPDFAIIPGSSHSRAHELAPFLGWHLGGTAWAFHDGSGRSLVALDLRDGSSTVYDLTPLAATWPHGLFALTHTRDQIVIVAGGTPPAIGVIDRASGRVERIGPPRCK